LTNDGSTEKVVALPYGLMGTQSNGNPYCGKTITVSYGGKTTTATVVDKCMGCVGDAIDLSNAAFLELAELAVGRATAEWWFN
jgi:expansin (peptidoglycan-binding protein)